MRRIIHISVVFPCFLFLPSFQIPQETLLSLFPFEEFSLYPPFKDRPANDKLFWGVFGVSPSFLTVDAVFTFFLSALNGVWHALRPPAFRQELCSHGTDVPPQVNVLFLWLLSRLFSLSLVLRSWIMMCLGIDLFRFILFGVSPTAWACVSISLTKFEGVFSHCFSEPCFSLTLLPSLGLQSSKCSIYCYNPTGSGRVSAAEMSSSSRVLPSVFLVY